MHFGWILDILPFSSFTIKGHSMEPTIKMGKRVLVFQWAYLFREPKIGDIIVFKKGKEYWVKRIADLQGSKVEVKGDNRNDSFEVGLIKKKDIVGRVITA